GTPCVRPAPPCRRATGSSRRAYRPAGAGPIPRRPERRPGPRPPRSSSPGPAASRRRRRPPPPRPSPPPRRPAYPRARPRPPPPGDFPRPPGRPPPPPAQLLQRRAEHAQDRHLAQGAFLVQVQPQRRLQGRQGHLVQAEGPHQRVLLDLLDQLLAAGDDAGL